MAATIHRCNEPPSGTPPPLTPRRRLAEALRRRATPELAAYALVIAAALALRLVDLGARPLHHDESQDAYFSWVFYARGDYHYEPILHGPLRFYLTSLMYLLFGASDFTARLAPALMGTAIVALPYLLRRQLGRVAAFATAVLLAADPAYLYFSRFAREDIYVACITLALIGTVFRFLQAPRRHHPAGIGALLALSFATKETTFITLAVAGPFFGGVLARDLRRARRAGGTWTEAPLVAVIRGLGWEAWVWGLVTFLGVFTVLFTVFLTRPYGLVDGLYDGPAYWLGQHSVGRGGEPFTFYGLLLLAQEWPVLLLGGVGIVAAVARPTLLRAFLVWFFAASLLAYSWAGEKFAWLVLHPLLPLLLLAGLGVQAIWRGRDRWAGRLGLVVVAASAVATGLASWSLNAEHRADPRELMVSTQSAEGVLPVRDRVLAIAARMREAGRPFSITVDAAGGAAYPWAWYFRDLPVGYPDLSAAHDAPRSPVVILTDASRPRLRRQLAGYDERRFRFRVWWRRDDGALSAAALGRWIVKREPWSPLGGMDAWLYTKRTLPAVAP